MHSPHKNTAHTLQLLLAQELERQNNTLSLIASENYASAAVREAAGSVLTNKYAEGYPGKRYYAGCSVVDQVEQLTIDLAKELFGAEHANVQPHAGSSANMAVYQALLQPGDTILGMGLPAGGHLTHGHKVNFSGTLYQSISYGVDPVTEQIDYDAVAALAREHRPRLIVAGASAYSRVIDFARFAQIAQKVGAHFVADIAHIAGLVAAGLHPSPVPYADAVTATTHKTLRGPRGGFILCKQKWATTIDRAVMPGIQGGPCMQTVAAKGICFTEAQQPSFARYQQQVAANAQTLAHELQRLGYRIVSGGTENHLLVIDLRPHNITGLAAEKLLESIGLTTSRSTLPNDTQSPLVGSGIRLGTAAATSRGMETAAMQQLAQIIHQAITHRNDSGLLAELARQVGKLCKEYPVREKYD